MLTEELQRKQVNRVKALLKVMEAQLHIDFRDVITGDASWIFLNTGSSSIWIGPMNLSQLDSNSEIAMFTMF
jgi:hypothetical protein